MTDPKPRAWNSTLPARTSGLARSRFAVPLSPEGKPLWADLKRSAPPSRGPSAIPVPLPRTAAAGRSKPKTCSMCHEPAKRGSWYCAACETVRALVLERDGYACVDCGVSVIGQHYSLGHRLRASQGGRAVPSNLITLLGLGGELCHGRIDLYRDPADAAKGYRLKSGEDPKQVQVMVFSEHGSGASVWLWDDGRYHTDGPEEAIAC